MRDAAELASAAATDIRYLAEVVLTCDDDFSVIQRGAVDVSTHGRIAWVGPAADAPSTDAPVVDLGGLLMPGLVNTHAHTPMTLVRGAGDGLPLMDWLTEVMWPREGLLRSDDAWWGMTLGTVEMLRSGITTSCEMYAFEHAVMDAARAAGIRLVMCPGVIATLDADASGSVSRRVDDVAAVYDAEHDPSGLTTVGFAPHSAYDLGIDACAEIAAAARERDALLHIHLAETRTEGDALSAAHSGASVPRLLADAGVFEGRVLAAHGVWLDDDDMDLCAAAGVAVAHCPISNMKLGSGVARVPEMIERGITVSLATDGPASNDSLDLWEEVKVAALLARVASLDPTLLGAQQVISMATRKGAEALGLHTGVLAPGRWADMIRLDIDDVAFVPVTAPAELIAHLAWCGGSRHVSDVWVGGERVVAGRVCLSVDESRARYEVQRRAQRLAKESGT
ncbi:amidohydrolase family protein [Candidatus Poriferisodalis sp.]|uniref:amidohydrolase family protein n=1 Tax=Candidatus Poriferisodalis sp. TaxID=3101277 RepID=UPI003B016A36